MKRWLRTLLGVGVSLFFLALFFYGPYRVDLGEMARALSGANYLLALPAALIYIVAMGVRSLRWRLLLKPVAPISSRRLFPVLTIGYMMSNLLPLRVGDLARAYYLGEREGASRSGALATVVVERVLDGLALLFLLAVASPLAPVGPVLKGVGEELGVSATIVALGLALPFLFALGLLLAAAHLDPRSQRAGLGGLLTLFVAGLGSLKSLRHLVLVFFLSVVVWLSDFPVYVLLAYAFGLDDHLAWAQLLPALAVTMAIANLVTALPSSSGGVGPFEFFGQAVLVLLGVGGAAAAAYILTVHLVLIASVSLVGLGYLWWLHLSPGQLVRLSGSLLGKEKSPQAPPSETARG